MALYSTQVFVPALAGEPRAVHRGELQLPQQERDRRRVAVVLVFGLRSLFLLCARGFLFPSGRCFLRQGGSSWSRSC